MQTDDDQIREWAGYFWTLSAEDRAILRGLALARRSARPAKGGGSAGGIAKPDVGIPPPANPGDGGRHRPAPSHPMVGARTFVFVEPAGVLVIGR